MRMDLFLFFIFLFSSCDEASQDLSKSGQFREVGIATNQTSKQIVLPDEAATIQADHANIHISKGTFPEGSVLTEIKLLESGEEGLIIENIYTNGDIAIPHQDIQVCIATSSDPSKKDIRVTSNLDKKTSIEDGIAKDSDLCLLTRIASGSFEIIPENLREEEASFIKKTDTAILKITSNDGTSLKDFSQYTKIIKEPSIPNAIQIYWDGNESTKTLETHLTTEVCLNIDNKNIETVSQIHLDKTISHHTGVLNTDGQLCVASKKIFGTFHTGPEKTKDLALETSSTSLTNPILSIGPVAKNSIVSIYEQATCSGPPLKQETSLHDGLINVQLSLTEGDYKLYSQIKNQYGALGLCSTTAFVHNTGDITAPTEPSLSIANATQYTTTTSVNLTLTAIDASHMYLTNTPGCITGGTWENYATTKSSWDLAQTNEVATVYVKFKDKAGNETTCINDSIIHDNQAPISSSVVIDGGTNTSDSSPDLSLLSTNASHMYITNTSGCASGGSWETYTASKLNWELAQINTTTTVYAKFKDNAGNETTCINDSIIHDNQAPTSSSITINSGTYTSLSSPDLTLSSINASHMYITNTSGCASGGSWETYATSKTNWGLAQTNATATVYTKFKDETGNETTCINDSIIHDNQAPTSSSITINGGTYTSLSSPDLTLSSTNASHMYITNISGCASGGSWETYTTSKANWGLAQTNATATVYTKFKDETGNETTCINDSIIHDNQPPTSPAMTISSGATSTSSSNVTLSPGAVDANEMFVTNASDCSTTGSWEAYSTTKTGWELAQNNSTALVYVKFKDTAGNETSCVNDTIIHDNTQPTAPSSVTDGTSSTTLTSTPQITWNAGSDGGSGLSYYEVSLGTSSGATNTKDWTHVGNTTTATLSGLSLTAGVTYYPNVRAVDIAGNTSSAASGDGFTASNTPIPADVNLGQYHSCALLSDQTIKCWGWNAHGQLGQGSTENIGDASSEMGSSLTNINLGTNRTTIEVSAGGFHTCARLDNQTLKCWGDNGYGQLGQGNTTKLGDHGSEMGDFLIAINLGTNRTASGLSTGKFHTCARLDNNTVKCWGYNASGQLGQGNTNSLGDAGSEMGDHINAIQLGTNRTALEISAGEYHTCARLDDHSVKCWGDNTYGQLGQGNTTTMGDHGSEMGDSLSVIDLGTNRTALQISSGYSHTCAKLDNNTLKCWGRNSNGQLGQGHANHIGDHGSEMGTNLNAIDLGTGRTVKQVSANYAHTCAILDNDTVKCWGENAYGQLGQGNTTHIGDHGSEMGASLNAIDLGTGRTALKISSARYTNCAILDNNKIKCWGYNAFGALGQEHTTALIGDGPSEMGEDLPYTNL